MGLLQNPCLTIKKADLLLPAITISQLCLVGTKVLEYTFYSKFQHQIKSNIRAA